MRECWYLGANPVFRASFYNMYESVQTIGHRVNNKDTRPISMFVVLIMSLFLTLKSYFTRLQQGFTCSKSALETLEKGVKYVQS